MQSGMVRPWRPKTQRGDDMTEQHFSPLPGETVQVNGHWYGVVDVDAWMITLKDEHGQLYRVEREQVEAAA